MRMRTAETADSTKPGAMLTRREYLCDASFLVVLQGDPALIDDVRLSLQDPKWTLYLGRKCCPPSRPLLESQEYVEFHESLETALVSKMWVPRQKGDLAPESLKCLIEWRPSESQREAPKDAQIHYDVPITLEPPVHGPRFVMKDFIDVRSDGRVEMSKKPSQSLTPNPLRPRADYSNSQYQKARDQRLELDRGLCVFCKLPATTVHHVTYKRAGGDEKHDDLRALCRLCHDAVTMLEYGTGMGMDRIDPCLPRWREAIINKRDSIIKYRSLETRRRRLESGEVE